MSLTEEKRKLTAEIFSLHAVHGGFEEKSRESSSYFKKYTECKHLEEDISEYSSEEMTDFREMLLELWRDENDMKQQIIPVMLVSYNKTKEVTGNYLAEIDLNNYMM